MRRQLVGTGHDGPGRGQGRASQRRCRCESTERCTGYHLGCVSRGNVSQARGATSPVIHPVCQSCVGFPTSDCGWRRAEAARYVQMPSPCSPNSGLRQIDTAAIAPSSPSGQRSTSERRFGMWWCTMHATRFKQIGTMAASRLMGVRSEAVNQGELMMVRTKKSIQPQPSQVKSGPTMHVVEVRSGEGAAHKTRGSGRGFGAGALEDIARYFVDMYLFAGLWCGRDLHPLYRYNPPTAKLLSSPQRNSLPRGDRERETAS